MPMKGLVMNNATSNDALLEVWSNDTDVDAARLAVDAEISAVELAERISKLFYY
jgi:hypothetical protein